LLLKQKEARKKVDFILHLSLPVYVGSGIKKNVQIRIRDGKMFGSGSGIKQKKK
jgi:hypothetical protein